MSETKVLLEVPFYRVGPVLFVGFPDAAWCNEFNWIVTCLDLHQKY